MLKVENIRAYYGSIQGIESISLSCKEGEVTSLIGANGAGKTTTLNVIFGLMRPTAGKVIYQDTDITSCTPQQIKKMGISYILEERGVFPFMTIQENLFLGAFIIKSDRKNFSKELDRIYQFFPRLEERKKQLAGTLSGGEQQMLAIARGLMSKPKLLILDEPSWGLAPIMVKRLKDTIHLVNSEGITILMAEQNVSLAFFASHKIYILETGKIILEGSPRELESNEMVHRAYLGR
jgi:branched-chain amino acid transport system ATP-binding protein